MEGLRPCPYCGGEVEMIKLQAKKKEKSPIFRIECLQCRQLVARGYLFPIESMSEGEERIAQYNEIIKDKLSPLVMKYRKRSKDHKWTLQNS